MIVKVGSYVVIGALAAAIEYRYTNMFKVKSYDEALPVLLNFHQPATNEKLSISKNI